MDQVQRATPLTDIPSNSTPTKASDEIMTQMQNLENQDAQDYQTQEQNKIAQEQQRQFQQVHNVHQGQPQGGDDEEEYEYTQEYVEEPKTMSQVVWESVKGPLFFLIIFILLSNDFVRTVILGFTGKIFRSADMVCWADLALRAILGAVLFFIIQKFMK